MQPKVFNRIFKQLKEENSNCVGIFPGAMDSFRRNKSHMTFLVKTYSVQTVSVRILLLCIHAVATTRITELQCEKSVICGVVKKLVSPIIFIKVLQS